MKYTEQEWAKLTREEMRQAVIDLKEPDVLYKKETYIELKEEKI